MTSGKALMTFKGFNPPVEECIANAMEETSPVATADSGDFPVPKSSRDDIQVHHAAGGTGTQMAA